MNAQTVLADGRIILDAARLKSLRKASGHSQESLAAMSADRKLNISIASIKRAETGKRVLYRTAKQLALLYCVDIPSLLPSGAIRADEIEVLHLSASNVQLKHLLQEISQVLVENEYVPLVTDNVIKSK